MITTGNINSETIKSLKHKNGVAKKLILTKTYWKKKAANTD